MTPIRPSVSLGPTCRAIRCWVSPSLPPVAPASIPKRKMSCGLATVDEIFMRHPVHPRRSPVCRNSEARDVCNRFPLPSFLSFCLLHTHFLSLSCSLARSVYLYLSFSVSPRTRETTTKRSEIGKCSTAVAQRTVREGYFNPRTRETGSTLSELMKSDDCLA